MVHYLVTVNEANEVTGGEIEAEKTDVEEVEISSGLIGNIEKEAAHRDFEVEVSCERDNAAKTDHETDYVKTVKPDKYVFDQHVPKLDSAQLSLLESCQWLYSS